MPFFQEKYLPFTTGRKSMIHRRRGSSSTLLSAFESCFSGQGYKKFLLDALDHRTLVYSHGIKSCDSCASKRHLSRVTSIILRCKHSYNFLAVFHLTFVLFLQRYFAVQASYIDLTQTAMIFVKWTLRLTTCADNSLKFFHRQFPPFDSDSRVVSILPLLGFD